MRKSVFNKIVYGLAVWGAFCLLFVVFHIIGEVFFEPSREHLEFWHEKTRAVFSDLELGFTKDEVLQIIQKHSWPEDQVSIKQSEVVLYTPFEWLASNWWISLGFDRDKLVSAKVRTNANPDARIWPLGAPRDLIRPLNEREHNK
jgi:hypothetical protein